jgi:hypothetical protein
VRQKYYGMRLTVIDVTGRLVLHSSWAYFEHCLGFDVATEQNRRIVKYLQLNDRGWGGRGLIIEVESQFLVGAARLGRGCSRLGGD